MHLARHERLHKVFVIHQSPTNGSPNGAAEFRILTKEIGDDALELLAYAYEDDGARERQRHILRAPFVPAADLLTIVKHLVEKTKTEFEQMQVLDLTQFASRLKQAEQLAQHDLLDAFDFE
ncbi:MAG: hypothetical protein HY259_04785 [Chloroflexi bacterium]|nr:hypothetical protein [Chloroflexota bacterium]MBI3732759.1 hypothetical protein [Chloroflexota bacterium]